jgi:hypothetical protein
VGHARHDKRATGFYDVTILKLQNEVLLSSFEAWVAYLQLRIVCSLREALFLKRPRPDQNESHS